MAKAQKRSSREAKKPKKIKEAVEAQNTMVRGVSTPAATPKPKKS